MIAAIRKVTPQPIKRVIVSHYHADHIYGLQAFKAAGAEIWAHRKAQQYLTSGQAADRLAQRRADLAPWVDDKTVRRAARSSGSTATPASARAASRSASSTRKAPTRRRT